jgi:hypothetical protein
VNGKNHDIRKPCQSNMCLTSSSAKLDEVFLECVSMVTRVGFFLCVGFCLLFVFCIAGASPSSQATPPANFGL